MKEPLVRHLKKEYEKAKKEGREIFKIGEYEFYTEYAKYLIEYLEQKKIDDRMPLKDIFEKVKETGIKTGDEIGEVMIIIPKEVKKEAEKKGWKFEKDRWICPNGHKQISFLATYNGIIVKVWCEECDAEFVNREEWEKIVGGVAS